MERHTYVRTGKFKNVNCGYALVNGIVFPSVYAAEEYCTREGLDVNTWIKADDPAVLVECKRIAAVTLPSLREMQKQAQRQWEAIREDLQLKSAARNKARDENQYSWELWVREERVHEGIGKVHGFYDCMKIIDDYAWSLQGVLFRKER